MIELKLLAPDELAAWADRLRPFLESICARSRGRYAPSHIIGWAMAGEWQLWVVLENGALTFVGATEIYVFPTGLKCLGIRAGTGRGRYRWQHKMSDVLAWGKAQGCEIWEGVARKGWKHVLAAFVPGLEHTHDFLEGSL